MGKELVEKWYRKLRFPVLYDAQFYSALVQIDEDTTNALTLDMLKDKENWTWNLIYLLSHCETMYEDHKKRGMPDTIIDACMQSIVTEVRLTYENYGIVGIREVGYFDKFIRCKKMFQIGRLVFDMEQGGTVVANRCSGGPIQEGENIILIHVPRQGKLVIEDCKSAIRTANAFFKKYYPEFEYRYYVFASWLMYEGLDEFLGEKSNIREFRKLFEPYRTIEDESGLKFAFSSTTTRESLREYEPQNIFQRKLKKHILCGGKLYKTYGFRARDNEKGIEGGLCNECLCYGRY